jgi:hypothetical protein
MEEVICPLREEASTINLWLARIANHLECVEPRVEHYSVPDVLELFGPCSPVRRSPTPSIMASLAAACMPVDSLCEDTCANTVDPILEKMTIDVTGTEIHQKTTTDQASEVLSETTTFQLMD